jgi:Na+/H+ antiporter NhaC
MNEKEIIEKYKMEILMNQNSIIQMKKLRPFGVASIFMFPFLIPVIPLRGKKMIDVFPYEFSVIICFILFSLMYFSVYSSTVYKKKKQIKRLEIWISQIENNIN